jgi:hypothetical protein
MTRKDVLTLKNRRMLKVHEAMVRKIVTELRGFDNVYYEICNEPYAHGVSEEWQERIAQVISQTETAWPQRLHLIAQNIANRSARVSKPNPLVSLFNFHYARPPDSIRLNWDLNRAVGFNETGFDGVADAAYRIQGWEFLLAGGALYNNLDFSFAAGQEEGTFLYTAHHRNGGGSVELRKQLGVLRNFVDRLDIVNMAPDGRFIKAGVPQGAAAYVLARRSKQYAVYIHHGRNVPKSDAGTAESARYFVDPGKQRADLVVDLPRGSYVAEWVNPKDGKVTQMRFNHVGGGYRLRSPVYTEDLALWIIAR